MTKLVALKRLRYPRGPNGKEYVKGQVFESLSDRDTRALTLTKSAEEPGKTRRSKALTAATKAPTPVEQPAPAAPEPATPAEEQPATPAAEEPAAEETNKDSTAVEPMTTENTPAVSPRRYSRRDMRAAEPE